MNFTKCEFIPENTTLHIYQKIYISFIWILVEIPGNIMLFNIIQFDRYGGDSLKRRLIDQVSIHINLFSTISNF